MRDAKSDPKPDAAFDVKSEQLCAICRQLVCTTFGKTTSAAKITDQSIVDRRQCSKGPEKNLLSNSLRGMIGRMKRLRLQEKKEQEEADCEFGLLSGAAAWIDFSHQQNHI